jgi:uncharacterized protein
VRIFVMGPNVWRDEEGWPLARARATKYLLQSGIKDRVGMLSLNAADASSTYSEFVSDPTHPVTNIYPGYGAHDYRALAGREDVLVFDTEPMAADMEVTGPIQAEIYVSADVPDFDLWVRLEDVAPNGTVFNLNNPGLDVLRTSYRNESRKPELLEPGRVYKLNLDRMLTSNVFMAGHRIRVQISGAFFPQFVRNLQTGESEMTSSATRIGHIRVYHDASHASSITLPVVAR